MGRPNITTEDFWQRVRESPDGCWRWNGVTLDSGYGQLMFATQKWRAHRLAWVLTFGPIPPGMVVCHACDTKLCCNPSHLWLGTVQANVRDRDAKGRTYRGPRSPEWRARISASLSKFYSSHRYGPA